MKNLSPPFAIKMKSGEHMAHCDRMPNQSYHLVQEDEQGGLWLNDRLHGVPDSFEYERVDKIPEDAKECAVCNSKFDSGAPFIAGSCIRCYECKHHLDRDNYRNALRSELKIELGIK